jgi:hypothetical protein
MSRVAVGASKKSRRAPVLVALASMAFQSKTDEVNGAFRDWARVRPANVKPAAKVPTSKSLRVIIPVSPFSEVAN